MKVWRKKHDLHCNKRWHKPRGWCLLGWLAWWLLAFWLPMEAWSQVSPGVVTGFEDGRQVLPSQLVRFETSVQPYEVHPGEHFRLLVTVKIAPGWHIYSVIPSEDEYAPPPTQLEVSDSFIQVLGPAYETNPRLEMDEAFGIPLALHKLQVRFYQNLQLPKDVSAYGPTPILLQMKWQVCNDEFCTPPVKGDLQALANLTVGEVRPSQAYMERSIDVIDKQGRLHANPDNLQAVLFSGVGKFLLLAASFGLLALLTPCVFPLIPVTVAFFLKSSQSSPSSSSLSPASSKKAALHSRVGLAAMFGLGIVFSITMLGFVITAIFGGTGILRFAAHPAVNLVIGVLFILFGFTLLGIFSLSPPHWLVTRVNQLSQHVKGAGGVLLMGAAFAVTSFTCTAPFVGSLLLASTQGEIFWPVLGMLTYSTVFATPFILLSLFPRALQALKGKSGNWMPLLKAVIGLVELMAALKFISNADLIWGWGFFTRSTLLLLWAILALLAALMLAGVIAPPAAARQKPGRPRMVFATAFFAFAVYFSLGFSGRGLDAYTEAYLPPPILASSSAFARFNPFKTDASNKPRNIPAHDLPWLDNLPQALQQAKVQQKLVFVDFTGYTCINCRWMEARIFSQAAVLDTLEKKFVLVQLYTDGGDNGEKNQQLQLERFRTIALPYYVILSADNTVLWRHAGIVSTPIEFLNMLEQTLQRSL